MKFFLPIILAASLVACSSTGGGSSAVEPKSLDETLAYIEAQDTGFLQSVKAAYQAGQLDTAGATAALGLSDQVMSAVSAAKTAEQAGNSAGAQSNLATASAALAQLAAYLTSKGVH